MTLTKQDIIDQRCRWVGVLMVIVSLILSIALCIVTYLEVVSCTVFLIVVGILIFIFIVGCALCIEFGDYPSSRGGGGGYA